MSLTYGSVCSGIEAATVAWHPLGMRPAWFCEIEPFPSAVLAHHYPEVPNYGDFTSLISKNHPRTSVDLLVGGTPCQAFSVAGLRGGLADPRGNLALAFVALVDALRPRWVVWENVPGVLSSGGGRDFGSFLGALGELGYGWAYRVVDAQYFGLAQRRKRVFVVASRGDWRGPAAVLFEPESLRRDSPPSRETGAGVAGAIGTGASCGGGWRVGADEAAAGQVIPTGGGHLDGISHALKASGPIDVATACLAHPQRQDFDVETFIAHTLRGTGHDAGEDGTGRGVPLVPVYSVQEDKQNGVTVRDTAGTVRSTAPGSQQGGSLVLTVEPQTFAWQVTGTSRTDIHDMPGRARAVTTAGLALREARGVRRLMPHELERLQGFPDGYTLIPGQMRKAVEDDYAAWFAARYPDATREEIERFAKDGPRAKALGNSMAVPCMRWIGRRILSVDVLL